MNAWLDTPLSAWHLEHGGRMVEFAGWRLPLQYRSVVEEHKATRSALGIFDVSHLGRFRFANPRVLSALDRLSTRRLADLPRGRIRYALLTNERGGVLDDVLVSRLDSEEGGEFVLMVVNAANRTKIWDWLNRQLPDLDQLGAEDVTRATAMIAVQGPKALGVLESLDEKLRRLNRFTGMVTKLAGVSAIVSRTGYTGEDGCELIVPAEAALPLWQELVTLAEALGGLPAGLGARDTLRMEAALPLYGHELSEAINAAQSGLDFALDLEREFIGREAVVKATRDLSLPRRVGICLQGRRLARQHDKIFSAGQQVGEVTSGTLAPTLNVPIAMGYVKPQAGQVGAVVEVEVRGQRVLGYIVPLPFYRRPRVG